MSVRALPWAAGKSAGARSGVGRGIADLLVGHGSDWYVEPFAGMLGVMLQRKRASVEIAADVDGRWYDWWLAVRDHPEALAERLRATPTRSRRHFIDAKALVESTDGDLVERAAAVAVFAMSGWHWDSFRYVGSGTDWPDVMMLADRLRTVSFWHHSAAVTLERLAAKSLRTAPDGLIYCDPPYPNTANKYGTAFTEADAEALEMQLVGLVDLGWKVAVSCAPGGFPGLEDSEGWHVEDFDAPAFMGSIHRQRRTERLVLSWAPERTLWS